MMAPDEATYVVELGVDNQLRLVRPATMADLCADLLRRCGGDIRVAQREVSRAGE